MQKIYQAIIKFQSQLKPINKDSENPFFKSSYADLSSILQSIMPLLTSHGLGIVQPMRVTDNGTVLITRIVHDSGEFIESEMFLPHNPDPQKFGSLISYYKRYQLSAMLSIATRDEDDDANKVSQPQRSAPQVRQAPPVQQSFTPENKPQGNASVPASEAQKKAMTAMNIYFSPDITKNEASKLIAMANDKKAKQ